MCINLTDQNIFRTLEEIEQIQYEKLLSELLQSCIPKQMCLIFITDRNIKLSHTVQKSQTTTCI